MSTDLQTEIEPQKGEQTYSENAKRNLTESNEINEAKRQKLNIPEGMSKNQWKKLQKQKRWEETKQEYRSKKKEKRKAANLRRKEKLQELEAKGETDTTNYHQLKKSKKLPESQIEAGVRIIMDCEFDDLMNDKEIVSLSNQITRSYSAKRHCEYDLQLDITSFNKNLKKRFDKAVSQYTKWTNINFLENEKLEDILPKDKEELSKYVYLTADTDEVINELEPGHTYIIGGIVDKNRHKSLCLNKAQKLGLKVGKLPIDKYIEVNGRHVLATSHVYEICCKWFENGKDWHKAFNDVLPPRKVKGALCNESKSDLGTGSSQGSETPEHRIEPSESKEADENPEENVPASHT